MSSKHRDTSRSYVNLPLGVLVGCLTLAAGGGVAAAQQQGNLGRASVREVCEADYRALCADQQPGGGRILACLKQNESKLSQGCQQALAAAKAARRGGGTGQ